MGARKASILAFDQSAVEGGELEVPPVASTLMRPLRSDSNSTGAVVADLANRLPGRG